MPGGSYTGGVTRPTSRGPECLDDETVVAFLEGALSAEARARVDAHVDRCAACLALVAVLGRAEPRAVPVGPERYQIRGELGSGGMGLVFEAFDTVLGRDVALKCVRPGREGEAAARRFEREMALTARLQHPSIIPVYDAGFFPDGSHYFAMRLVEGQTLDAAIEQAGDFEEKMALVPSIRRACEAVAFAHDQSVVHRDLKPANVLIGPFGETVVLDWGLAKRLGEDDVESESFHGDVGADEMTRPGAVMGTRGFIAPEVERGDGADARSDVFALGKVLAQVVSSERSPGTPREVWSDLQAIIDRATAREPGLRYADARELYEDLRRFEAGQRVAARDYSLRSHVRRLARRHRTMLVLSASLVVVGALVGVGVASMGSVDGPEPCAGAEAALEGVWDEARRTEVKAAFDRLGRSFATRTWARTSEALDARAHAWIDMHTEACRATVRGEQSGAMLDLRMACLDRAATELRAVVDVLAQADIRTLRRADEVVGGLGPLSRCADARALEERVEPPPPDDAVAVAAARDALETSEALRLAGRYADAQAALADAHASVRGIDYPPVLTELELAEGRLHDSSDRLDEALASFETVMRIGAEHRQWREVGAAAVGAMGVLGGGKLEADLALRYRALAEGMSKGDLRTEADFRLELGAVLFAAGRYEEGQAEFRAGLHKAEALGDRLRAASAKNVLATGLLAKGEPDAALPLLREALAVRTEILGEDHPTTAETRVGIADALSNRGAYVEAERELRDALTVLEEALEPTHHEVAEARSLLGMTLYGLGRHEEAEAELRTVVEIFAASRGREHPSYALAHYSLGFPLVAQGKFEEAEAVFRVALAGVATDLGEDHPLVQAVRGGLASALSEAGKLEASQSEYRALLASFERTVPPEDMSYAIARGNFAELLRRREKLDEAEGEYRAAIEILGPQGHPLVPQLRASLARQLLESGRGVEALPIAEQAWLEHRKDAIAPETRARTAFILARILWVVQPDQRARARTLAEDAAESYGRASAVHEPSRQEVEDWLAER